MRSLIWVSNDKDSGPGSLRAALDQGNQLAKQGKPIEIAFKGNYTIKPTQNRNVKKVEKFGSRTPAEWQAWQRRNNLYDLHLPHELYGIYSGDWLINKRDTKNITIDGSNHNKASNPKIYKHIKSAEKNPLFTIYSLEKVDGITGENTFTGHGPWIHKNNSNMATTVDITRINLINNSIEGWSNPDFFTDNSGVGGGLGAGAAVLHWGGHLTWRDSVFQGNTVKGGLGAKGASGGPDGIGKDTKIQL